MGPVYNPTPPNCGMGIFGKGDGEKRVCVDMIPKSSACTIISIGCNNEWSYENSAMKHTLCDIHVFDCTGDWPVPDNLKSRVTLHKKCVATKSDGGLFVTWAELVKLAGGGTESKPIAHVKMDIEGFEWGVMAQVLDQTKDPANEPFLPLQISMEVHLLTESKYEHLPAPFVAEGSASMRVPGKCHVYKLFRRLNALGKYQMIDRHDNPYCPHCSEVLLVRGSSVSEPGQVVVRLTLLFKNANSVQTCVL
jgi:hypothetical protein